MYAVLPVCPVCDVGVLWPNDWTDQDETWHAGRPQPRPHCVRWGYSCSHRNGHSSPPHSKFMGSGFACVLFAASVRPYNAWSMSVVAKRLDGSRCSLEIGMVVGLGPGHTVLDGDPAPLPQMGTAPNFQPMLVVAKRLDGSRCHLVGR